MLALAPFLALMQDDEAQRAAGGLLAGCFGTVGCVIGFGVFALIVAGMWKVFEKAGHPGWAAIVPIYNAYILTLIAGRDILWLILLFIPIVNIVAAVLISLDVARKFGKDTLYGIGLAFLGFIFYPLLGFGDAQYNPNA
ncbi:MAG TPA: DUF5684 domain-containing protein [Thermoanaerobaculia bacterium]|nr:DUF5684 domain-containing protein [Thermoanaerobaculia bacterium]